MLIYFKHFIGFCGAGDEYELTSWPNENLDLAPMGGTIELKTWNAGDTGWISNDTTRDPVITSYDIFLILGVMGIVSWILLRKKYNT